MTRFHLLWVLGIAALACGPAGGAETGADGTDGTDEGGSDSESTGGPVPEVCEPSAYTVTIGGDPVPVERVCKFDVPVNYVHVTHPGTPVDVDITTEAPLGAFTLSPKSRGIETSTDRNTLSFTVAEPAYLVLQAPEHERFFVLLDPPEVDAPRPDDENVRNVADLEGIDSTGRTEVTELIQGAIDAASGSAQNIVYVPPGVYATTALYLKDDVTLYLAEGATLQNVSTAGDLLGMPAGLTVIEGSPRGYIVLNGVQNAKVLGRGTIDGNGATLQASGRKQFLIKIENSANCVIDGIIARDSTFWNTLVYRSDGIQISNVKVINNQLAGEWNETDGVDFNNTTNSTLSNAFLYTGDDCMAVKSDDIPDDFEVAGIGDPSEGEYVSVDNIVHERVVCFSASSACKVGTKTFGETMSNVTFRDVDVISAIRGLVIDAVDTANITGTVFEDIRIENVSGNIVDFNMDPASITWRVNLGIATVTNTTVTNVSSDVNANNRIQGNIHDYDEDDPYYGNEYFIDGVTFNNFSVEGNVITALDDPNASFTTNEYAVNITFSEAAPEDPPPEPDPEDPPPKPDPEDLPPKEPKKP